VQCRVFDDADSSGTRDDGEALLPGVRLTNGVDVVATDAQGEAHLWVDRTKYRFATLTIPAGWWPTTPWFHPVPVDSAGPDDVEFGLRARPASAADVDSIRWVHLSDTQVDTWGHPYRMDVDLEQVDDLPEPPLFLVNTGDLVEVGSDTTHWNNYVSQLSATDLVVFPVVGNHDTLATATPLEYYEQYMGPPYYSFEAGRFHFIVYNDMVAPLATPAQDAWLANDVAAAPPGSFHLVFKHFMLQETLLSKVEAWATLGVVAGFSGHWHAHQFGERPQGILEFNICRTRSGPLDRTPRAFGIVTCTREGEVRYDLRRLAVDHRAEIASPPPDAVAARDAVEVLAQAYDTSARVQAMSAALSGPGGSLPAAPLAREGISLWRGILDASSLPPGAYDLAVTGTFEDGTPISLTRAVALDDVVPIRRWPGADWPMFRKCPSGSSFVATPLEPPLALAWAAPLPGMVALSSPVVADGRVFLGCRAERETGEAGVLACDAATGAIEWFSHVPAGVALAPAVAGDVVIATAMTDSVFGLDAATGARVWSVPQRNARYSMTAPIFEGDAAWVGAEPRPMQIRAATGATDWMAPYLGDPWFPYVYSAPALGPQHVAYGFFGFPEVFLSGGLKIVDRQGGSVVHEEQGAFRSPVHAGSTLYVVGGSDRNHQVLTARTPAGAIQWTAAEEVGSGTGSPALGHGTLVVPGSDGAVRGYRAADGAALWTKPVGVEIYDMESGLRGMPGTPATAAITDSTVWIGSLDGNLYALDLATGAERWRWSFGVPVASSAAVSGNMLFVAAEDEHLYGFVAAVSAVGAETRATGRASVFSLYPPRPNPSATTARFAWVLPSRAATRLRVFDVGGRLVRTLVDGVRDAGEHEVEWDGADGRGAEAAAGVYFVRLDAGRRSATRRFVRLRR
jgi:outer membrane protein assembly factor BamB